VGHNLFDVIWPKPVVAHTTIGGKQQTYSGVKESADKEKKKD